MNPKEEVPWTRVKAVLAELLSEPESRWPHLLVTFCGDDQALKDAVVQYLPFKDAADQFLEQPSLAWAARVDDSWIGRCLGAYRLQSVLGRGGMGTVFLAERADAVYEQKVAVKILSHAFPGPTLYADFERERQLLAHLQHPYIARILNGGTTQEGLPFYVMEYIQGKPMDQYCRDHQLTIRARLKLFGKVCDAVHHAHQNLIIHRDLKPSNILITPDGNPKLLDFGTAKMLAPSLATNSENSPPTRWRAMTPEYASPEQVTGKPMTTASDVYALGIVLYEMLTGSLPYVFPTQAAHDMHRTICESKPMSLAKIWQDQLKRPTIPSVEATHWQSTPHKMMRHLRGDLNTLVAKALQKQPEQRYGTVAELHADLKRFQQGLPIHAEKASAWKRGWKFIKRHQLATTTAALALSALTAAFILAFWQANIANQERHKAEQHLQEAVYERIQAQHQFRKSETVTNLLVDLFKVSDPFLGQTQDLTARDILDRGADQLIHKLEGEPVLKASIMDTLGRVYMNLGSAHQAEPLLEEALRLRQSLFREDHADVAHSHHQLGKLARQESRFLDAEHQFRRALAIRKTLLPTNHPDLAETYHDLAATLQTLGYFAQAELFYQQTLDIHISQHGNQHPQVARTLVELSELAMEKGQWGQVEATLFEALTLQKQSPEAPPIDTITTQQVLAEFWLMTGEYQLSRWMFEEVYATSLALLGASHPRSILLATQLTEHLAQDGSLEDALAMLHFLLEEQRRQMSDSHLSVAGTHSRLARLYSRYGDMESAKCHFHLARDIFQDHFGNQHPYVANTIESMALFLGDFLSHQQQQDLLLEALAIRRQTLGNEHPHLARNYNSLGWLAYRQDDLPQALNWYEKVYALQKLNQADDVILNRTENILAILFRDLGNWTRGKQLFESVLAKRRTLFPANHPELARTLVPFGELLLDMGDYTQAGMILREGLNIRLAHQDTPKELVGNARFLWGLCLWQQQPLAEHQATLLKGFAEIDATLDGKHPLHWRARERLVAAGFVQDSQQNWAHRNP